MGYGGYSMITINKEVLDGLARDVRMIATEMGLTYGEGTRA